MASLDERIKQRRRRNDHKRKKGHARRIYPHDALARSANHMKVCSCPACGNPRRHFGARDFQEIRADQVRHED